MIQVKTFYAQNELRNFSYLLYEDTTADAWVIDPFDSTPIIEYIKKQSLRPRGILNTHHHWDHIRGNLPLQESFDVKVRQLNDSEKIKLNDQSELEIMDTPGHTLDHQVFLLKENHMISGLFAGDTLFNAGVGNCKNGGNVDLLFETTMKLKNLPSNTILYPGHDYILKNLEFSLSINPDNNEAKEELRAIRDQDVLLRVPTTLEQELKVNPFFHSDKSTFYKLRSLRDNY